MKITSGTIVRIVLLVVAIVNQILTTTGHSILPIDNETISETVSLLFTIVVSLIAAWKNNSITKEAREADEVLRMLKKKNKVKVELEDGTTYIFGDNTVETESNESGDDDDE